VNNKLNVANLLPYCNCQADANDSKPLTGVELIEPCGAPG